LARGLFFFVPVLLQKVHLEYLKLIIEFTSGENTQMKKYFVRDSLLKSLTLKLKHNRILLISISVFLAVMIIFSVAKLIQIHNKSIEDEVVANINQDKNNNNENQEVIELNDNLNEENMNTKRDDYFVLPKEGIRPVAVMIDNEGTICLPQGGLHKAQIIYEIVVEGGVTRYMPIYWFDLNNTEIETGTANEENNKESEDDLLIGPIRSARHYFLDYVFEHDAIYVHFGWSPQAQRDISNFKVNNINGVSNGWEIFWDITNNPNNWQDSYTLMSKITEYVKKVKYRTETDKKLVFTYNEEDKEPEGDNVALNVLVEYNQAYKSQYIYDPETKEYNRLRNNEPHMERATNKQLKVKNIIVQFAHNYTIKGDPEGRQEVQTTGSGEGWYITCGKAIKIRWSKNSRTEPTIYTDENGNPITLNPGQTWIQIISPHAKVEISNQEILN